MSLGWFSKQKSRHRPHKHWTVLRMITVFKSKSLFCVWTESRSHTCKLVDDWHSGNHGSRLSSQQGRNHSWLLLTKVLLVTGDIISSNSYFFKSPFFMLFSGASCRKKQDWQQPYSAAVCTWQDHIYAFVTRIYLMILAYAVWATGIRLDRCGHNWKLLHG